MFCRVGEKSVEGIQSLGGSIIETFTSRGSKHVFYQVQQKVALWTGHKIFIGVKVNDT